MMMLALTVLFVAIVVGFSIATARKLKRLERAVNDMIERRRRSR